MDPSDLKTLILPQKDIQDIIQHHGPDKVMDDLIASLAEAVASFDPMATKIPVRSGFNYEKPQPGLIEWMPLYYDQAEVVLKLVGYHPKNPSDYALPTILSNISAYDTRTGHLKTVMDGVLLTSLRTGAASAVASRLMAHPESRILGLIGCGAQAVTQLHALSRVLPIEQVLIYDIDAETVASFAQRCASLNLNVRIIPDSIQEVVRNSDILCTATSIEPGAGPLFSDLETKPFLHINAVGSDFPGKVEVPLDFLRQSFVCPDFLDQALIEGECQRLEASEINEDWTRLAASPEAYSALKNQRTVFDSTGWALEDAVVLKLFSEYASNLGLGKEIQLEAIEGDAKGPYEFLKKTVKPGAKLEN